ncbi:hypothetical protein GCK72_008537 [Caenorhabditis remanei]|uniref:F-box domain-containing protein n=1 Tax=Caenorhabditis remanei TaxID=31234 RepID=A0A6A5GXU1_CAERE|nr:hypothetical protein GCK72_008537 [Caenorhabditis remanei]KAF1760290.1 hypothetical protein GCK72_008537 [Caenorhabditis remanei]
MEPTFPLFRLPENAIVHVLKNMDPNQLLIISLVSLKSKNLVTSLELGARCVFIDISWKFSICLAIGGPIFAFDFYNDLNGQNEHVDITLPVAAHVRFEGPTIQSSTLFNISDWMNHIRTVFCYTKPLKVNFFEGCERFEVQSLKNTIGNVDFLSVAREVTDVCTKEVLKHFNAPNEVSLDRNPFDEACEIQKFFIQNYKVFTFYDIYSLDDMLLANSEKVYFYHPTTQNQINQFLKHWIHGSNPRMQQIFLSIDNTNNSVRREVLLRGIHCVDEEEQQKICQNHGFVSDDNMVAIRRNDRTPAVIVMNETQPLFNVLLVVLY